MLKNLCVKINAETISNKKIDIPIPLKDIVKRVKHPMFLRHYVYLCFRDAIHI